MADSHSTDTPILKPGTPAREEIFIAKEFAHEANRRVESVAATLYLLERAAEADGHVTAEVVRRVLFLLEEQANAMAEANYKIADAFDTLLGSDAEDHSNPAMH